MYLEGAAEKRDRVADFIHFCEGMAELAKAEGKRLQARQKHFEATAERVSAMVLRVLDYLGVKKLEGRTNTLKKRKCPPSVRIIDEAKVPAEYKHITVTLPLPQWQDLLAGSGEEFRKSIRHPQAGDFRGVGGNQAGAESRKDCRRSGPRY